MYVWPISRLKAVERWSGGRRRVLPKGEPKQRLNTTSVLASCKLRQVIEALTRIGMLGAAFEGRRVEETPQLMRTRLLLFIVAIFMTVAARAIQPVSQLEVRYLPVGAMLTWTCADAEVTGFTIERSVDGFTFDLISRVVAEKGLADTYNFLDNDRPDERHYYRVTSFDRVGTTAHSPLAMVERPGVKTWHLSGDFTVDVRDKFAFEVEANDVAMLACDLHDFLGNPVSTSELLVTPGPNELSIATTDLEPGSYRLTVSGATLNETIHFVKVHAENGESTLARRN